MAFVSVIDNEILIQNTMLVVYVHISDLEKY